MKTREQMDAEIIANATHYEISLFLGRGQYARGEAGSIAEAKQVAERIRADHPRISARPLITAVDGANRSAPIRSP